jgi:hypothetical protein
VARLVVVATLLVRLLTAAPDPAPGDARRPRRPAPTPTPASCRAAGAEILPDFRVVAYYGAPQDRSSGRSASARRDTRSRGSSARRSLRAQDAGPCCPRWS